MRENEQVDGGLVVGDMMPHNPLTASGTKEQNRKPSCPAWLLTCHLRLHACCTGSGYNPPTLNSGICSTLSRLPPMSSHMMFPRSQSTILTEQAVAEVIGRLPVALDAFAGCGGNTVALAQTCRHVVAVDIDEQNARTVQHNAGVYGLGHVVQVICGDFFSVAPRLQVGVNGPLGCMAMTCFVREWAAACAWMWVADGSGSWTMLERQSSLVCLPRCGLLIRSSPFLVVLGQAPSDSGGCLRSFGILRSLWSSCPHCRSLDSPASYTPTSNLGQMTVSKFCWESRLMWCSCLRPGEAWSTTRRTAPLMSTAQTALALGPALRSFWQLPSRL